MLRKTLYPQYWTHEFTLSEQNLEYVYGLLSQGTLGIPAPFDKLAISLIGEMQRTEDSHIQKLLSLGSMYQPKEKYDEGQVLVFTALDYRTGTVQGKRSGQNPEHGRFDVVEVEMQDPAETVEFAAQLRSPHPLNALEVEDLNSAELMSAEEIYEQYGDEIKSQIRMSFSRTKDSLGIMEWRGGWIIEDLLVEVDEFARNVAEALMFERNQPVSGRDIQNELKLNAGDAGQPLLELSLEIALTKDERFLQVMYEGELRWHTRSMLPELAQELPALLNPVPLNYKYSALEGPLLALEVQLRDEWSAFEESEDTSFATFYLLYPHFRYGTMPVTPQIAKLLDITEPYISNLEITDPLNGDRIPAWYVPEGRYIYGLEGFYESHKLSVGARLTLERRANGTLALTYNKRRGNREWLNVLNVEDGAIHFKLEKSKTDIAHEFMSELLVSTQSTEDDWRQIRIGHQDTKVFLLVEELVRELVKGSGTVNAATVYGAVNLVQRHAPGPVFHALMSNSRLVQMEDQVTWRMA